MRRVLAWARKESLVVIVVALFGWAFAVAPDKAFDALATAARTALSISLIILSVFSLLGLFSVLVDKQAVGRRLGKGSGLGTLLMAAGFGTILVGPVYAVFPLLKAFREHGARWAVLVTVMTAWAVKLPMIPLEMRFLGWRFSAARTVFTLVAAVLMGPVMERLLEFGTNGESEAAVGDTSLPEPARDSA